MSLFFMVLQCCYHPREPEEIPGSGGEPRPAGGELAQGERCVPLQLAGCLERSQVANALTFTIFS